MRMTVYSGWLMVILGVVIGGGAAVAGQAGFGAIMLVSLAGSGAFMVWLAGGLGQAARGRLRALQVRASGERHDREGR